MNPFFFPFPPDLPNAEDDANKEPAGYSTVTKRNLIKSNLGGLLARVFLVESAVCVVSLLLNSGAKLHQILWHLLVGGLEDVDESSGETLLVIGEESYGSAVLASTTGTRVIVSACFTLQTFA